ncbi:VanZ family protein [Evansella sp. AB-rgal1]|uniref:VanZ family protein n=1 Tax=Evansella sp. AB-rgal1 TaxID=3242696 RepID=UPI00359D142B
MVIQNVKQPVTPRFFILYVFPLLTWVGLIYFSSSQSYEDQNVQPILEDFPLEWVEKIAEPISFTYGDSVISLETRTPAAFVEFFLRKGAHLFAFAVMGLLAYRVFDFFIRKRRYSAITAWLFVTLYASIDEFRQLLHPNRTGMVEDVILDSVGGMLGISAIIIWRKWRTARRVQRQTSS